MAIMADALHVLFVPGAWLGGWSWIPVATRVAAAGYGVTTLTLPGLAPGDDRTGLMLEDAIGHVAEAVTKAEGSVVLVAHSGGGTPAAAAAVRLKERVVKVVFVDAYVPLDGVRLPRVRRRPSDARALALSPRRGRANGPGVLL